MFEFLKRYRIVFVTGPQRSGTRICAHMIASDARLRYVDEMDFFTHDESALMDIIKTGSRIVIQCPAMCHRIHKYNGEDIAVVFMLRDVADIVASQERIGWAGEQRELKKYRRKDGVISEVKYTNWLLHQRGKVHNYFEIEYRKLKGHPLWVPREQREKFEGAQWKT